jgi:hypothetical protein
MHTSSSRVHVLLSSACLRHSKAHRDRKRGWTSKEGAGISGSVHAPFGADLGFTVQDLGFRFRVYSELTGHVERDHWSSQER